MTLFKRIDLDEVPDDRLKEVINSLLEHLKLVPIGCYKHDAYQWYGVAPREDYE